MRRKQVGGIGRQRPGGDGGKIGDGGMLNGDEIKTGNSREIGAEGGILSAAQIEDTAETGRAQGAEGFGHLRVGHMLGYELDALVVTVVRRALEQFDMRAVAVGFGKSGKKR